MNGAANEILKREGEFFCRVKCAWQKNNRAGWTLEVLDEDLHTLGVQFLAAPAGSRWLDELTSAVGRLWADDYATQTAVLGGDLRAAVGLTGAVRITRKGSWFNCAPICPAALEASMSASRQVATDTAAADDDEASVATEPAATPAAPAAPAQPSPMTVLRAWAAEAAAATRPAWRHSSVDVDAAVGCVDIRLHDGTGRGDDWAVLRIDDDGRVTRDGKNGACRRLLPDVIPQAVIDAALEALRCATARARRAAAAYDADDDDTPAYSGGYDGDDHEMIAAHMREARRGRRAYDRW